MEIENKPGDENDTPLDERVFPVVVVDVTSDAAASHSLVSALGLPLTNANSESSQSVDSDELSEETDIGETETDETETDEYDDEIIYEDPFSQVKGSYSHLASLLRASGKLPYGDREQKPTASVLYILNEWFNSARPFIEPRKVSLRRNGSAGADSALRIEQLVDAMQSKFINEDDQQIGKLWSAIASYSSRNGHGQYAIDTEPQLFTFLLTRILSTGRCHLQSKESPPLKLAKPLPGKVIWQEIENHQRLAIIAIDEEKEYMSLRWRYPWYVNKEIWTCGPIEIDLSPSHIEAIFMASPVSKSEAPSLRLFFSEIGLDNIIPLPKVKKKAVVKFVFPQHTLTVETKTCVGVLPFERQDVETATATITSTESQIDANQLKVVCVTTELPELAEKPVPQEDGTVVIERYGPRPPQLAPQFERMGFQEIAGSIFGSTSQLERYFVPLKPDNWVDFVWVHIPRLRENGWHIADNVLEQFPYVEVESKDIVLGFEYEDSNWWFTVSLTLELDGQKFLLYPILVQAIRSLPRAQQIDSGLVDSLNRNGKFVAMLPNKRIFAIPFDRLRPILISIAEMISFDPKLPKMRVSLLDSEQWFQIFLLTTERWLGESKVKSLIECLKELCAVPRVKPPRKFRATLRPYQIDGLSWLQVQAKHGFGGILADDMGLGKTIQLLAHVCLEKQNKRLMAPFLVICPTSVLPNWLSEAAKFCPHLKVVSYQGPDRHARWSNVKQADLVISTYPLILRDLETFQNNHWHGIALDESQAIKSSGSLISEVIGSLPANHRFCMTGTPIENHVHELWAQFRFLLPGLLGDEKSFDGFFTQPIELNGDVARAALLTRRIQPFVMRRTKAEVAADLPEKTTIIQTVQLQGAQRDLYETVRLASTTKVRAEIREKGFKQSKIMIFDVLLKLRQVCCDPRLVKLTAAKDVKESTKLEVLLEKVAELIAQGRKILLFSQFTSMLDLIAPELEKSGTTFVQLRGDTRDRVAPVNRFQSGEVPLFLISLKAGGTGLNLTAADTVIHYDPWWNPAVEEQATDRAHRIGQKKNVFVYKLIAEGTIEQRMLELQERKRSLANMILDGTGSPRMSFTEEELEYLLSPIDTSS